MDSASVFYTIKHFSGKLKMVPFATWGERGWHFYQVLDNS